MDNPYVTYKTIGVRAMKSGAGFRPDGSYFYGRDIFEADGHWDAHFKGTFERIERGRAFFEYGVMDLSPLRSRDFASIVRLCDKNGVKVILFAPPVAGAVLRELSKYPGQYGYLNKIKGHIKSFGWEFYNFFNASTIGADDCEFVDGFHGGDVVSQRILREILRRNPSGPLAAYVNADVLNSSIAAFKGKALIKYDGSKYLKEESDFLKISCSKTPGKKAE